MNFSHKGDSHFSLKSNYKCNMFNFFFLLQGKIRKQDVINNAAPLSYTAYNIAVVYI